MQRKEDLLREYNQLKAQNDSSQMQQHMSQEAALRHQYEMDQMRRQEQAMYAQNK